MGAPLDAVLAPQFQPGGALVDQGGSTGVRLPEQLSLGVAFRPTDKLQLLFDYGMQNWKVWDTIVLDFEILADRPCCPQDFKRTDSLALRRRV